MAYLILIIFEIIVLLILSRKVHKYIGRFFYKITKSKKLTVYLSAILFLPGTFVHEMSHFLTALFLLVPVGNMDLLPKITESDNKSISVTLGSVAIGQTDPIRRFLIGAAPFFLGLIAIFFTIYFGYFNKSLEIRLLIAYIVFTIANNMFSSKKDMEGSWILLVVLIFSILCVWIFGINFPFNFNFLLDGLNNDLLKTFATFMIFPVIFDIITVVVLRKI